MYELMPTQPWVNSQLDDKISVVGWCECGLTFQHSLMLQVEWLPEF